MKQSSADLSPDASHAASTTPPLARQAHPPRWPLSKLLPPLAASVRDLTWLSLWLGLIWIDMT